MSKVTIKDILAKDETFRYRILSRMKSDCDYYLGNGQKRPVLFQKVCHYYISAITSRLRAASGIDLGFCKMVKKDAQNRHLQGGESDCIYERTLNKERLGCCRL